MSSTATAATCPSLSRNLSMGSSGSDVQSLQRFLKETGDFLYPEFTLLYGPVTVGAVQKFQCRVMGICVGSSDSNGYGAVGPMTRAKIANSCTGGVDRATIQAKLQTLLKQVEALRAQLAASRAKNGGRNTSGGVGYAQGSYNTYAESGYYAQGSYDAPEESGWDYDLTKKCLKTVGQPGSENYYAVTNECSDAKRWTIAIASEKTPGAQYGPANRSFLVNGPDSPVTVDWHEHKSGLGDNWTVNMKTDFVTHPHPDGDGYFTWVSMMDHVGEGGGPLPDPADLITEHRIAYNNYVPTGDNATRLIVGAQFFYGGKAHLIEINLSSTNWGDAHSDPEAVIVRGDWYGDGSLEYVTLDGAAFDLTVTPGDEKTVEIEWSDILEHVIDKGWLSPIGNQDSVTQGVFIATEVKNGAIADLWHTNFRVTSK